MKGGFSFSGSFSPCLFGTSHNSWQGGVLERIERHLIWLSVAGGDLLCWLDLFLLLLCA
jgi:hypothetical protein